MNKDILKAEFEHVEKLLKTSTKETALARFVKAGILTKRGNFRKPYKILDQYMIKSDKRVTT